MVDQTSKADLLFELGTEELPPLALKKLSAALTQGLVSGLSEAGLIQKNHAAIHSYATPRRLAVLIKDCQLQQPDTETERRGPAIQAAYDAEGKPTKAAEGFARSCGTRVDQLDRLKTDKGEWLMYQVKEIGKAANELLPAIAETALNQLPIPKRMRWGASEAQFVRPVHWLLFLHGDAVVNCNILDTRADRFTHGHRFHHPEAIEIRSPSDYASVLESKGYVLADFDERRKKILDQVQNSARALGDTPDLDDELLDEVTALNEWPVPITGTFEEKYLGVPQEALVLTMKINQKYFPLFDAEGRLTNHFITIANIDSPRPEVIRDGNERVIRPRLSDAMFFWQQDGRRRLEGHMESLKSVVFEKKLGSMFEKSERIADLAECIANQIGGDTELTHRAGLLSRCDLMTEMVNEFPKMQGIMGRYQAQRDGEPEELSRAMDEFYMPRYSGDALPQTKAGICIALAERLDTLVGIFGIGERPTGDKDPFALRRAAVGALRIIREHSLPINLTDILLVTEDQLASKLENKAAVKEVYQFMMERLRVLCLDQGIHHELFQSVAAIEPDSLADFDRRLAAVQSFLELPEAKALAEANKRIRNILKKAESVDSAAIDTSRFTDQEERQLHKKLGALSEQVSPLLADNNYEASLKILSGLQPEVDAFFDKVMVMHEDQDIRTNRLALLSAVSQQFRQVADIGELH